MSILVMVYILSALTVSYFTYVIYLEWFTCRQHLRSATILTWYTWSGSHAVSTYGQLLYLRDILRVVHMPSALTVSNYTSLIN